MLEKQIDEVFSRLLQLGRGWIVNADSNIDRMQRQKCAKKLLDWLTSDKQAVYERVKALEQSLAFDEGDQWQLSDFADMPARKQVGRPDAMEARFPRQLQEFLHEWATVNAPRMWEEYIESHPEGGPWLSAEDFGQFTRYLRDYFCSQHAFDDINGQLLKVVGLKLRDEAAKRRARRKYVRIMLNDYMMNPGPTNDTIDEVEDADEEQYGLMAPFVTRWRSRLPEVLALGAGAEVRIPPGNDELIETLEPFDGQ
jgi:hypothetical protein